MSASGGTVLQSTSVVVPRPAEDRLTWSAGGRQRLVLPAVALSACIGYYVASLVGLQLRLLPGTTSAVWPPNAVLTSLLVLTPLRRWWVVLVAALPAHLYLELGTGWSLPFVLSLFVTNCAEALLAAGGMYLLSDAPWRFDTLRRLTAFVVSVIAAATLSSFADAAAVTWFQDEPYWHVWGSRLPSNSLAALIVVPAVVGGFLEWRRWWSRPRFGARAAEALILALGLCAIAWVDFSSFVQIPALRAVSIQTPLAIQLPLLLWAAVRFGAAGTGMILLPTGLMNAWAVVHGQGPFTSIPPTTTITALTLSQIVVATTLLYLATLIEERRRTQQELRRRLQFEGLLSRLSGALMEQPSDQTHRALETWLGQIATVLDMNGLTLFALEDGTTDLHPLYAWVHPSVAASPAAAIHHLSYACRTLGGGEAVVISNLADPHDRAADRSRRDTDIGGAVPLIDGEQVVGAMAFGVRRERDRSDDLIANARLVAEVLASAMGRKRFEDALRESELMKSAILQSLTSGVAVIDRGGRLQQLNDRWTRLATECDWMDLPAGGNVIDRWRAMSAGGDYLAGAIADGVAAVLDASRGRFSVEHSTDGAAGAQWWSVSAVPLNWTGGGAVLTRSEITELRRAEIEARRSREELAHVSRVSTVGEMTASLAHQLNQPLAAILTNAQVAQRLLESIPLQTSGTPARRERGHCIPRSDLVELRAILGDIVADDRRATDVILRLRKLLRKGDLDITRFDLTAAIRELIELVEGDAAIRNISIRLEPVSASVTVRGDRVQLQQVVLNLLQNAMEAMTDCEGRRLALIRCRHLEADDSRVGVSVRDSGPGISEGAEEAVFEPFYTTKSAGMGMGLSIVRSIVEAHGGSIRVVSDRAPGAHFELILPVDGPKDA